MTGRRLMTAFLIFVVLFGVALWYAQHYAFYEETEAEAVTIAGQSYPVADWRGIDAATSPLKLRACFRIEDRPVEAPVMENPTPLVAPGWFECFDAGQIARDLASGSATAYLAETEEFEGANRVVAVYPDGRAYMWRQLTPEYADQ